MLSAVVVTAVTVMMMSVMVAMSIGIVFKRSPGESLCRRVGRTLHSGVETDSGIGESVLCAHTDSAADQRVNLCCLQESRKSAVTAAVCVNDLLVYDFTVLDIIELELHRVSEMLKDLSIFISYCDFHFEELLCL